MVWNVFIFIVWLDRNVLYFTPWFLKLKIMPVEKNILQNSSYFIFEHRASVMFNGMTDPPANKPGSLSFVQLSVVQWPLDPLLYGRIDRSAPQLWP